MLQTDTVLLVAVSTQSNFFRNRVDVNTYITIKKKTTIQILRLLYFYSLGLSIYCNPTPIKPFDIKTRYFKNTFQMLAPPFCKCYSQ